MLAEAFLATASVGFFGFGDGSDPGLRSILAGEDYAYGVPLDLVRLLPRPTWEEHGFMPSPPWRLPEDLPLQQSVFETSGARVVNQNCFACHAGVVAGNVVAGLGNMHVDAVAFKEQATDLVKRWDSPLQRLALDLLLDEDEMSALGGYVAFLRTLVLPSIHAVGKGDIHGPWVVWRLIARMKDPAAGFELYPVGETAPLESLLDRPLPPVRPNPWWRLKYKKRAFWTADVSPHSYATFALNAMDGALDDTATFPERMERMRAQLEFARKTEAPPYPRRSEVDREAAARGREVFHRVCAGCHGTYDADGRLEWFPNRAPVPIETLGTDPEYATILHRDLKPLYEHFAKSPFAPAGEDAVSYPEVIGYAPQPLVGIWAAAPYFHNGSVPTVMQVLDSTSRARYWRKSMDVEAYDYGELGAAHEALEAAVGGDRRVYATDDYGKGNGGHRFGDGLSGEERRAVVEYLRLF